VCDIQIEAPGTPSVLCFCRQNVPVLEGSGPEAVAKGAYVLSEHGEGDSLDLIIASTGNCSCYYFCKRYHVVSYRSM
jgi:transketolase